MCVVHIASKNNPPKNLKKNEVVFWWDGWDCSCAQYSIPHWYEKNFLQLRQELTDFVYELGKKTIQNKAIYEHFCAGDRLSMWWCSLIFEKHPILTPNFYDILKLRSMECMLKVFVPHCTKIILHHQDKKLIKTLSHFCNHAQLDFQVQKQNKKYVLPKFRNFIHDLYKKLIPELKSTLRFLHWFICVRMHLGHVKHKNTQEKSVTILSYYPLANHKLDSKNFNNDFHSPYWGSLQDLLLQQQKNIKWLFMRINQPQTSLRQTKNKLKKLNLHNTQQSFYFAEEFLKLKDVWQVISRYCKLVYTSHKLEQHIGALCFFTESKINFWPYLKEYYKESFQGWICLERALQRKAMLNYIAWAGPQEYTLFPLENCPWERALVEAVHHAKAGLIYGAQHSVLRNTDLRYFDSHKFYNNFSNLVADKILVNGHVAFTLLAKAHCPTHKLCLVEALRYEYLYKYSHEIQNNNNASPPSKQAKKLLVVTSFFKPAAKVHIKLLASWLKQDEDAHNWQIYIKAHPYCNIDILLQKYLHPIPFNMSLSSITELLNEFQTQGGVVWAANDTSVSLECMYAQVPLIIQGADGFNLCPVQGIDALKYVHTYDDVRKVLAKPQTLIFDKSFFVLDASLTRWRNILNL